MNLDSKPATIIDQHGKQYAAVYCVDRFVYAMLAALVLGGVFQGYVTLKQTRAINQLHERIERLEAK